MRKIIFLLALLPTVVFADESFYKEGDISLCKYESYSNNECQKFKIRVGKEVRFTINIFTQEFFGVPVINANATIDNTTDEKLKSVYHISFYDGQGQLIGAHGGGFDLQGQQDINYGSALIYIPKEKIEKVRKYQLRTYILSPLTR